MKKMMLREREHNRRSLKEIRVYRLFKLSHNNLNKYQKKMQDHMKSCLWERMMMI